MKHSLRLITLLLAFACVLVCFVSCNKSSGTEYKPVSTDATGGGNNNGDNSNDNNIYDDDWDDDGDDWEDDEETPDVSVPDIEDFGSNGKPYEYKALVRTGDSSVSLDEQISIGNNGYAAIDFWASEKDIQNGDAITYAVYLRNSLIEELYNCRIIQVP